MASRPLTTECNKEVVLHNLIVHGHGPCTQDGQLGTEVRPAKAICV